MDFWGVVAILVPLAGVVFREFMTLYRDAARRDSIERLLNIVPSGARITDRTADGGSIEIVVDRLAGPPGQPSHQHGQSTR